MAGRCSRRRWAPPSTGKMSLLTNPTAGGYADSPGRFRRRSSRARSADNAMLSDRAAVLAGKVFMKLLLTSSGISNPSIHDVLVGLLGKPIAESSALFVPTAIYPFPDGADKAFKAI